MRNWKLPAIAALAASIAACTVGPDYVRPESPAPAHFASAAQPDPGSRAELPADPAAVTEFWNGFNDPLLSRLVEQALASNHDLRIALANLDRANALLGGTRFDAVPVVTAEAEARDARASADQLPGVERDGRDAKSYSAGLRASWELDLFGRIRRGIEAQSAEAGASAADLAAAQIVVAADVASTYAELRGLQERLRVANDNARNQLDTLRLLEARFSAGRGTEFDTSRATAQLETTRSRIPALESAIAIDMHRIAVLTGQSPEALVDELQPEQPLPALPARIDAGTPGELLRRRPDVAAAEQRLHAATARIGVATADLFPRFTLGGLLGSQAIGAGDLFERDSETRLLALGVDWSFLDVGHVRARISASNANASAELARYEQSVLRALEDTENALTRYAHARVEDAHLQRAAASSSRAAELARTRFDAGASDLLEVLDAERTRLQAQDALAVARTQSVTSAIGLYRAMAGGWPGQTPQRKSIAAN
ncbi:efflux transporter outer membrane subunit [Dokdonella immobilis]|uniref:Efflux transporter, outer membrane factor (OMF) lipoprotein, NodT family n=1 Tax=Dokdonella immobilis TaxID=578942 RepID=A0A1I4XNI8_9GAMM|nr:efflux transporter outer membrane subunit [Dokdonella immobilis]SFN27377.1 efflux transporter, outer membrane factor (OMF) lipoprotein, NodT family [Dokdonella immobilis]